MKKGFEKWAADTIRKKLTDQQCYEINWNNAKATEFLLTKVKQGSSSSGVKPQDDYPL